MAGSCSLTLQDTLAVVLLAGLIIAFFATLVYEAQWQLRQRVNELQSAVEGLEATATAMLAGEDGSGKEPTG